MSELGERLRVAREERELTVEQVAEATRIPLNYLYALEEESFDVFTSDLHARGFLRNYASFLGLDPEEIVDLLDELRGTPRGKRTSPALSQNGPQRPSRSILCVDLLLGLLIEARISLGEY